MLAGPLIGVLDLQGDVREHLAALAEVGCAARTVKRPADLEGVAGLVLPGGESTTLSMLLESTGLFEAIADRLDRWFELPEQTRAEARATLVETVARLWSWEGVARGVLDAAAGNLGRLPLAEA